jgi:hypothetical protein
VHGALDAGAAGVAGLERYRLFRGAGSGLGLSQAAGGTVSWRRFLPLVVHRLRAGQGPQSSGEKVATIASLTRCVHGVHDAGVLPCGQVTVWLS